MEKVINNTQCFKRLNLCNTIKCKKKSPLLFIWNFCIIATSLNKPSCIINKILKKVHLTYKRIKAIFLIIGLQKQSLTNNDDFLSYTLPFRWALATFESRISRFDSLHISVIFSLEISLSKIFSFLHIAVVAYIYSNIKLSQSDEFSQ